MAFVPVLASIILSWAVFNKSRNCVLWNFENLLGPESCNMPLLCPLVLRSTALYFSSIMISGNGVKKIIIKDVAIGSKPNARHLFSQIQSQSRPAANNNGTDISVDECNATMLKNHLSRCFITQQLSRSIIGSVLREVNVLLGQQLCKIRCLGKKLSEQSIRMFVEPSFP
jgi:hypothetical protein